MTDHIVTFRTLLKVSLAAHNLPGLHGVPCSSDFCRSDFGSEWDVEGVGWGNYRMIHLTTVVSGSVTEQQHTHNWAYSHPVWRILAPASHSESCTLRTHETSFSCDCVSIWRVVSSYWWISVLLWKEGFALSHDALLFSCVPKAPFTQ